MEDLASSKKKDDFRARRLSIIDVSSEDDSLLGLGPGFLHDDASSENQEQKSVQLFEPIDDNKLEELFEPVDGKKLQKLPETDELVTQTSECLEPGRIRKNEKYNLRKSLAWDSAFFTCEGVLDAEELSSMISVDKSQKRALPGIQEEVHRSTDSISTLGSDTFEVESVETSLFDDVRASIQRSRKHVKLAGESSKVGSGVIETKVGNGSKKMDLASQSTMPKVAAKKPSISMQNPGKLARIIPARTQFSQSVAASGVSTSSVMKQSKVPDKTIPSSTRMAKRASLGGDLLKVEKESTKVSASTRVSKLPGGLRNVPRPSKSSSLASSTATTAEPTSSFDSSSSISSVKSGKSPSNSMKRKTDSKTVNPTISSRSNPKTPSRITSGDRTESGKSRISTRLVPLPKLSSSISPASSISDWSAESVSSVSSSQQVSGSSKDSLSKNSSKRASVEFDSAQSVDSDDQSAIGSATRTSRLPGQGALRASMGVAAFPPTSRPSGLRLPSPKIGFFDGVKSAVRTPKRNVPSDLPKAGIGRVSPQRSGIKSKLGKVNPEKAWALNAVKPDSQQTGSNTKPKICLSQEASKAATKEVFDDLRMVESCPVTSPKVKTNPPFNIDEEDSKAEEVGNGGYEISSETKSSAHEDVKITHVHEQHNSVSDLSSIPNFEKLTLSKVVKDAKNRQVEFETDETKSYSEDQIDCLIRQVGAIEITGIDEMVNVNCPTSHQKLSSEDDSLPNPVVSVSPTSSDNFSVIRIPFSAKDSLCNIGGSFDVSKGSIASEGEKNGQLTLPEEHFDRERLT